MSGFVDTYGSMITTDKIRDWLFNAQAFYGTASQESEANATVDAPCSIFNPSNSGKNIFITSWIVSTGTGSLVGIMFDTTVDPAYASSLNIKNAKGGGATSAIASSCTFV